MAHWVAGRPLVKPMLGVGAMSTHIGGRRKLSNLRGTTLLMIQKDMTQFHVRLLGRSTLKSKITVGTTNEFWVDQN